jgi:cell division septation protein DedD
VSDQYEPSYYEIALTGRQVLSAFVILLVCMVAAFFSGVWVGRGGGQAQAQPQGTEEASAKDEEPRLQELSFFEEEPVDRPRDLETVARDRRPDTTLREDVEGRSRPAVPPTPPPAAGTETPPEPRTDSGGSGADREPSSAGGGGTAAAEPSRPAEPSLDPTPSGSLTTGDVVIQVFSSSEEAKAREVLGRLEKNGFRAFLSPVVDAGRTLYRVRVGPFEHRSEAEEVAERLRRSLNMETWITQ